jgi:RNA polymerase sigma-70 factor (ECF subfamily)
MSGGRRDDGPGLAPGDDARDDSAPALDPSLRPRLVRFFVAGPWPREEAEDLAQRTFALALRHRHQLAREESLLPWLFAIARNVRTSARRQWGRRRRVEAGGLDLAEDRAAPAAEAPDEDRAQRLEQLQHALAQLPPRQRQCLLLQLREELSYEEIGRTLAISPDTVRNHLAQARANLRRFLEGSR